MVKKWQIQEYMVICLDVLDQSNEILKLPHTPVTEEERQVAQEVLGNTARHLQIFRQSFRNYMRICARPSTILTGLDEQQLQQAKEIRKVEVEIRGISDSLFFILPIQRNNEFSTSMSNIYRSLFGICGIYVAALLGGKPFRGGADIEWGVRMAKREVYGAAVVKAVQLEKQAEYPRVVIGDSLLTFINQVAAQNSHSVFVKAARHFALNSKSLITTDYDNRNIIDMIGSGARSVENGINPEWVALAYNFVVNSCEHFDRENDKKLYQRYSLLKKYFESRLHLWDIQPAK